MKYKKTFKIFIEEAAKIVRYVKDFQYSDPRRRGYVSGGAPDVTQIKNINNIVSALNRITSKYGASVDFGIHAKERMLKREVSVSDIVGLFKDMEKNTKYFDDLQKNNDLLIEEKGPQMINTTKLIHVGTIIKRKGTQIVIKTVIGKNDFDRDYIGRLRKKKLPLYFTR